MTREEFIDVLKDKRYSYKIEGDKLVVTHEEYVNLMSLETLPPSVEFKNAGSVSLNLLKTLPHSVGFKNGGSVGLRLLETVPPSVEFKNGGDVYLATLFGGWFRKWNGNIEGIDSQRLLNFMISKGMFI